MAGNTLPWIRVAVEKPMAGPGGAKEVGKEAKEASLARPADGCFGLNANALWNL